MSIQFSEKDHALLVEIMRSTRPYPYTRGGKFHSITAYSDYTPKNAPDRKRVARLVELGRIECYGTYTLQLTADGWKTLNTTPEAECLADVRRELVEEIVRERRMQRDDTPRSADRWRLQMYRDLYKEPDMTAARMESLERDRVFNNRLVGEYRIQELEHKLAQYECWMGVRS